MKDETAKNNWAMKKGMQMVQGLNDEASKVSQDSSNEETKSSEQNNGKKRVHWSGTQSQGFQTCAHTQHCQDNINNTPQKAEHVSNGTREVGVMQPEEAHELKQILKFDTDGIMSLDTGSTFN